MQADSDQRQKYPSHEHLCAPTDYLYEWPARTPSPFRYTQAMIPLPLDNEGLQIQFITSPVNHFPVQLRLLTTLRSTTPHSIERTAINNLILLACTAFIETVILDSLGAVISQRKSSNNDDETTKVLTDSETRLDEASFKELDAISVKLLSKPLSKFCSQTVWEGTYYLFALRNQIIHGKKLKATYKSVNGSLEGKFGKGHASLVNFLLKKKMLDINDVSLSGLVKIETTDYFVQVTKDFFTSITEGISKEFKTNTFDRFANIRSELQTACV